MDYKNQHIEIKLKDEDMTEDDIRDVYIWLMEVHGYSPDITSIEDEESYLRGLTPEDA